MDTYDAGYQGGAYRDPFAGAAGQKLSMPYQQQYQQPSSQTLSAGQRLALAIVSVVMLVPLSGIIFGTTVGGGGFGLLGGLIGLGVICLTIMVINIAFNARR
jgi:uncharacterized membrane protein